MRRMILVLGVVLGCLAVSGPQVSALDCYYGCDPLFAAGTSGYVNEFCCPGLATPPDCLIWNDDGEFILEAHCAESRIDFLDDAGAGLWGPLQEIGGHMSSPQAVRYDIYYGECEGDSCIWTAHPRNTFTRLMDCCANCFS